MFIENLKDALAKAAASFPEFEQEMYRYYNDSDDACSRVMKRQIAEARNLPDDQLPKLLMEKKVKRLYYIKYEESTEQMVECLKDLNEYVQSHCKYYEDNISFSTVLQGFLIVRRNSEAMDVCDGSLPKLDNFMSADRRYFYHKIS